MKYTSYFYLPFFCLILNACKEDQDDSIPASPAIERPETLAWIEDTMRGKYYWNTEIPEDSELDYTTDPETFFPALLYPAGDGKKVNGTHYFFSYIEKITPGGTYSSIQKNYSYGFEFSSVRFTQTQGADYYGACVLYALPGSPAARAGLKRGDWIVEINDRALTIDDLNGLLGGKGGTFRISRWQTTRGLVYDRRIEIEAAEPVKDNPVHHSGTYSVGNKKVGYLAYHHFTAGVDDYDYSYDDELRTLSAGKFDGVDEFVLDLRYNGGGLLSCTQLLCAILGPQQILSESKIGYLEYNNGLKEYFAAGSKRGYGRNLNLRRLFVLVSAASASASEAVINLLSPFMEVIVIGRTTTGKNVGSHTYESTDGIWKMHPITFKIFNSEGKSDYADGWPPDIMKGDIFDYDNQGYVVPQEDIYELGDPNERLLRIALNLINGSDTKIRSNVPVAISESANATPPTQSFQPGPSSIDQKRPIGLLAD
jgi:C-terminal processing protease CtpA/Prc